MRREDWITCTECGFDRARLVISNPWWGWYAEIRCRSVRRGGCSTILKVAQFEYRDGSDVLYEVNVLPVGHEIGRQQVRAYQRIRARVENDRPRPRLITMITNTTGTYTPSTVLL